MVSLTPERLVGLLNENSSRHNIPPLLAPPQTVLLKHPTLLPGERILLQQDATCVDTFTSLVKGILHLTTYRVIFNGAIVQDIDENSNSDDDPTEMARKGYIYQTHCKTSYTKKAHKTLDRFIQKAQNFQESLASKPSTILKPSRSRSKDLLCPNSPENEPGDEPSCNSVTNEKYCTLISVQEISAKKKVLQREDSFCNDVIVSIPCTNIYEVRKLPKNSLAKGANLVLLADGIELLCSTLHTYKFCLALSSAYDADKLTQIFSKYTKHLSPSKWFAIAYKNEIMLPKSHDVLHSRESQNFYKFEVEFGRLSLLESDCWKILFPQKPYYTGAPIKTLVPFGITEADLFDIVKFHGGKSYPAICWKNQQEDTIMLRSGAALYRRGIFESRCEADEKYLASICYQNKQSSGNKLVVFTEQYRNNTPGLLITTPQQISGQITAKQGQAFCYPHIKFVYTDKEVIPDHRAVKLSSYKLQALLSSNSDDKNFHSALGETQWLSQISELLETASLVITALSADKSSVLISYEDGCDRTAQLSSLSQLLLDPHYRTIDGFQDSLDYTAKNLTRVIKVLIQKEWLSFGHMFADRCISQNTTECRGPVFLQWLDCVWQLTNQFPLSFEFNEEFLQVIADHAYSCRFGTFLCNSEQQHKEEEIEKKTIPLWTWINLTVMADPERFANGNFRKGKMERVLMPRFHIPSLKVWESYYAKTRIEENLQEALQLAKDQSILVEHVYAGLLNKYNGFLKKCNQQDDGQSSESSVEHDLSSMISSEAKQEIINDVLGTDDSIPPQKSGSLKLKKPLQHSNSVRQLESRSLDNLLETRRSTTQSKTKRRLGSSKFYVNNQKTKEAFQKAMAELSELKPAPQDHVRKSQTYDDLCDYLKSEGYDWSDEIEISIEPLMCCGFLSKLGNVRKNWLKRWFKLDLRKNCLAYFEKQEDDVPKGVIECGTILEVFADERPEKINKNRFYTKTPDRTFEFKAPNQNLMKIWVVVLGLPRGRINVR